MSIQIRLSTTLRDLVPGYDPESGLLFELKDGESVLAAGDVAQRIGIPPEEITIIMINSRQSDLESLVRDGDRVAFFPPVGGG
ncbi:MoaD/ThiS family protein [Mailhella massiliensis]|uniref:MoaD/ThiS family protein n=1 Tax=Mailhella massiliensis TaxID=1903261 RepID=A0A921DS53_9BACT|nr:MoaD/ThiS family protein [Mailhella massiliensis]HJD96587.1 MoaD/ThiS family protein [Mailhella massiliensis]